MLYNALKFLHVLSIIIWIGGMIYTLFFLRPAVSGLDPAMRVKLMHDVLGRFFKAVLIVSTVAVGSGLWMVGRVAKQTVQAGGSFAWPTSWIFMTVLGLTMFAIFGHIRFALYKRLTRAISNNEHAAAESALTAIRTWVTANASLGVAIVAIVYLLR